MKTTQVTWSDPLARVMSLEYTKTTRTVTRDTFVAYRDVDCCIGINTLSRNGDFGQTAVPCYRR